MNQKRGYKSEIEDFVQIPVMVWAVSAKALLVSQVDHPETSAIWIPKSQTEGAVGIRRNTRATIGIKRWFLKKEDVEYWEK